MVRTSKTVILVPILLLSLGSVVLAGGAFRWWSTDEPTFPAQAKSYHHGKEWPLAPRPECNEPLVHQYHTQKYWPDPYRWQDRANIRAVMSDQADRGWLTATTLYDQHFDPETQELNLAGTKRLQWILLQIPAHRRQPWVQTGDNTAASQMRLASVQIAAAEIAGPGCPPPMLRVCRPIGLNGEEADRVRRRFIETAPDPRLPFVPLIGGGAAAGNSAPPAN